MTQPPHHSSGSRCWSQPSRATAMTYQGTRAMCPQTSTLDSLGVCLHHMCSLEGMGWVSKGQHDLRSGSRNHNGSSRGRAVQRESQISTHPHL